MRYIVFQSTKLTNPSEAGVAFPGAKPDKKDDSNKKSEDEKQRREK